MQKTIIASATIIAIGIAVGLMFSGRRERIRDIALDSTRAPDNKVRSPSPQARPDPSVGSGRTTGRGGRAGDSDDGKARHPKETVAWQQVKKGAAEGWMAPFNVSKNKGNSASPSLAISKVGKVLVAWHDNTPGNYEILCRLREAGDGSSEDSRWGEPVNISKSEGISVSPTLTIDQDGSMHAVWADGVKGKKRLFYSKSAAGTEWSKPTSISSDRARSSYYPSIAADSNGNLHLVSNDTLEHESDVFYRSNVGGGWRESEAQRISKREEDSMGAFIPRIALDGSDNLFVVCHYFAPKGSEIHCIERSAEGEGWSVSNISRAISEDTSRSFNPSIAIDGHDIIHVVWDTKLSKDSPSQIYYARKNGRSWTSPVVVSKTPEDASNPSVAVGANGDLHVAWVQKVADRKEIFYAHYAQSGGEMSTGGLVNISSSLSDSVSPRISIDGDNNVHIVWGELIGKQAEIFYSVRKSPL